MLCRKILGIALFLLGVAGCTAAPLARLERVEIRGKVLLSNGAPLSGGILLLRQVEGVHGASASLQQDGSFDLLDPAGAKAVVPGKYQVFVLFKSPEHKSLRSLVSSKYQDSEDGQSDLFVDIQEARHDLLIRLKS